MFEDMRDTRPAEAVAAQQLVSSLSSAEVTPTTSALGLRGKFAPMHGKNLRSCFLLMAREEACWTCEEVPNQAAKLAGAGGNAMH